MYTFLFVPRLSLTVFYSSSSFHSGRFSLSCFLKVQKVNKQVWIALGSITIIGVSAIPVFGSNTRPGHEMFSSEKPEAIREAQEAKRQEYRRLIKEQREAREKEFATPSTATSTTEGGKSS